jgi:YVTN family beta-propeller protein
VKKIKVSILMLLALILFGSSIVMADEEFNPRGWSRSSSGEGVWIDTVFNPKQLNNDTVEFQVYLTTHSGDLLGLDFDKIIDVRTNLGEIKSKNIKWEWERRSSHHPAGKIKVSDQQDLFNNSIKFIEITFKNIRDVDHILKWKLESKNNEDYAYIANANSGTVSVVDTKKHQVINTIKD